MGTAADMEGEGKSEGGGRDRELKEKKEKVWKRGASDLACKAWLTWREQSLALPLVPPLCLLCMLD